MTERSNNFSEINDHKYINNPKNYKTILQFSRRKEYFEILKYGYWNLMKNSTVITNSEFSKREIVNALGLDNIYVLSPPIDITRMISFVSSSSFVINATLRKVSISMGGLST